MPKSYGASVLILACLLFFPLAGQTQEKKPNQWSLGSDIGYYDNIDRVPNNGRSETIGSVQGAVLLANQGTRYQGDLSASAEYLNYFQNTYSDEVVWGVSGDLIVKIVPDVFDWRVVDNYGPYWVDPLSVDTPDNRAYVNYFETGPLVTIPAGDQNRVVLQGSYARSTYSKEADTEFTDDLEYRIADVAFIRDLSAETSWSIHGNGQRTSSLDDPLKADYDIYEGYVRFETKGSRTRLSADVGVTRLDYTGDPQSDPLIRLDLKRQLSELTALSFSAGTEYNDSAGLFVSSQNNAATSDLGSTVDITGVNDTLDVTTLDAPLKHDYATLSFSVDGRRTRFAVGAGYSKEDFESSSSLSEQKGWDYFLLMVRQVTDSVSVSIRGNQQVNDYQSADQNNDDTSVDAAVSWSLGKALSVVGKYGWGHQSSTVDTDQYTYNSISLGIYYSPYHRPVIGGFRR